jgi:calcium permeable stress-gated cation channel
LGSSIGITAVTAIIFSIVRPYNTVVYAPKLKHADEKHAPPPLGKGLLAWVKPLWATTEQEMVGVIGMDATIFLRFTRMCRNLFVIMTVIGCSIMIPINLTQSIFPEAPLLQKITPMNVWNEAHWGTVIVAWSFCLTICGFLWWNYRQVMLLRRQYFESDEYQQSLHARSLMVSFLFFQPGGISRLQVSAVRHSQDPRF